MLAEYSVIRELETEGAAGLQIEAVSRGEIIRDSFKSTGCIRVISKSKTGK